MSDRSRPGVYKSLPFAPAISRSSSHAKKRPQTPTAPLSTTKRPKTGPFLIGSGSDSSGDSDDDVKGFNHGERVSATRRLPRTNDRHEFEMADEKSNNDFMSPRASLKQRLLNRATPHQLSAPEAAADPLPGKGLDKSRLKMLLEKKKAGMQGLTRQKAPLLMGNTGADLRSRPMSGAQFGTFLQERPDVAAVEDMADAYIKPRRPPPPSARNGTTQQSQQMSTRSEPQATCTNQTTHSKRLELPRRLVDRPLPEVGRASQATRVSKQMSTSLEPAPTHTRIERTPVAQGANTALPHLASSRQPPKVANSSSPRNVFDSAKAGHRTTTSKQKEIGDGWQKAKTGRNSTKSAKKVKRPEVGARYGHTLTARKAHKVEETPPVRHGTTPATSVDLLKEPTKTSSQALEKNRAEVKALRTGSDPAPSPVNQTHTNALPRPTADARQNFIGGPFSRSPHSASLSNGFHSISYTNTEQTDTVLNGQERGLPRSSSTFTPSCSYGNDTTHVPVVQEKANAGDNGTAESESLANEHTASTILSTKTDAPQTPPTTIRTLPDTIVQGSAEQKFPRKFAAATVPGLATYTAKVGVIDQEQVLEADTILPGPTFSFPTLSSNSTASEALTTADQSSVGYHRFVPLAEASNPQSLPVEHPNRPEIPVAVMVGPEKKHDSKSPLGRGGSYDGPNTTQTLEGQSGSRVTSRFDTSVPNWPIVESDARRHMPTEAVANLLKAGGKEKAASVVSKPTNHCLNRQDLRKELETTQIASSVPEADIISQQLSVQPSDIIDSAQEHSTPIVESSQNVPGSPFTSSKPPTAASSDEIAQLIASATLLSPRAPTNTPTSQAVHTPKVAPSLQLTPKVLAIPTTSLQSPSSTPASEIALPLSTTVSTSDPYFEYTIHQTLSFLPPDTATTEISVQPFTSVDIANAQTEVFFRNASHQYEHLGMYRKSSATRTDENGLSTVEGAFESIEDPCKILSFKVWTQRNEVGTHASPAHSQLQHVPLLSRKVYTLRLWKLIDAPSSSASESDTDSDSDNGDEDDNDLSKKTSRDQLRVYCPLPDVCTEMHTTLDAANRAAKRVQIALSHEKEPRQPMQKQWQGQDLRSLNAKIEELRKEVDGMEDETSDASAPSLFEFEEGRRTGCWRSVFNGVGLGADRFELLVSKIGVSGPRNL
ncbi:hypothetical protein EJ07DRAFT_157839 [Lizonia empirigonia]|nr:hypothetical protein EJ07DRAFT_157839 [Lizonia empirigonia]